MLQVLSASYDGTIRLWDLEDGLTVKSFEIGQPVHHLVRLAMLLHQRKNLHLHADTAVHSAVGSSWPRHTLLSDTKGEGGRQTKVETACLGRESTAHSTSAFAVLVSSLLVELFLTGWLC